VCLAALSLDFHCCLPHFQYVVEKEGLEGIVVSGSIKVDRQQTQCLVKSFFKNWRKCLQDSWEAPLVLLHLLVVVALWHVVCVVDQKSS